jgi:putative ABC transport system permease protein
LRADWKHEWEAELSCREALLADWNRLNWRTKSELARRSMGAFWDALRLQPKRLEDEMLQDLRFGSRMLLKSPGFTTAAILSLTIGIGATTAIFSVVNSVVLRPLAFQEPDRLMRIWHNKPPAGMTRMPVSAGNINIWRNQAGSFKDVAAFYTSSGVVTGEGQPERIAGAGVSSNLLPMLGYQPLIGRNFRAEDNQPGNEEVIILSHKLWRQRFGSDPAILGRQVTLDHTRNLTVIGVMPAEVDFPEKSEFWLPEKVLAANSHGMRRMTVIARLKSGVTPQMARDEVTLINQQLQKQMPEDYENWEAELMPLHESIVGEARSALLVLFGAVVFVLLIACANVSNLLLARATARQKEIALRAALGASRWRLLRQLLTESTLLALLGGVGGVLLAYWAVNGLIALNPPGVPRLAQVSLDLNVLAFTLVITLLAGLVFGLAPALHSSKPDLNNALKEGAASNVGSRRWLGRFKPRDYLVVAQTALAVVLLAGAGLLIKSFMKLQQVELGVKPDNVVAITLSPPFNRLPKTYRKTDYYKQLVESLQTMPGVAAAAATTSAPTTGAFMNVPFVIAGQPDPVNVEAQRAFVTIVTPDYFRAVGNQLKEGRVFTDNDNEASTPVAIINETMARTYFAGESPIGQRIAHKGEPWMEIVGVASDVKQFSLDERNKPSFYRPYRQQEVTFMTLAVHTSADPAAMIPALRNRIQDTDKFTAITRVRTLSELISDSVAQPRFYTLLLAIFAGIALALAALGIYGLVAYSVSHRTHEIGIRVALGAESGRILRLVVGRGLILILTGVGIGLAGAIGLTRVMTGLLFEVKATDPGVFVVIALVLIAVALVACLIPARRATKVDPLVALRHE